MTRNDINQLLTALPLPATSILDGGRIEAVNPSLSAIYPAATPGKPFALAIRQPAVIVAVEQALAGGGARQAVVETLGGGRPTLWQVTATPAATTQPRVLLVFEDRTALEESSQIRRDFVANVSHELRSPLTALTGFIETLKSSARHDPAAQARFLDIMEREANRMARLVQDLLALSRVEADERLRPTQQVNLADVVAGVLSVLAAQIEAAGVTVTPTGFDAPLTVAGDGDQLRQVFTNLVENAIKYGGSGGQVTIAAEAVKDDPGLRAPAVRVTVADRGEGFAPHHIPRLTERFYRIDDHRSRQKGGTGLGLAIVKHIVNRHRGRLKIESTPGQGSRFTVILPA